MINKSTYKLIKSLAVKKYRIKENLFLIEGDKNVLEALRSDYSVKLLIATETFLSTHKIFLDHASEIVLAKPEEIKKASLLKTPQNCIAICELPSEKELSITLDDISFFLDSIQDPGNLGTIIRTCDWFGIDNIFCSKDTVDLYNPKVIQATMGSFCRVNVCYTNIEKIYRLPGNSKISVYGTFLDGSNVYTEQLTKPAIIVVGNEGNGISNSTKKYIDKKICIPGFRNEGERAESLNVAVATAIICSEFRRKIN